MARYFDYSGTADIFEAMRTERIDGVTVAAIIGGGDPMPLAIHFMHILLDQVDLASTDRVLDIGCGCGRLAAPLTRHLGGRGSYVGVDIVAGLIDFANRHIAQDWTNFRFLTMQQGNPAYDGLRREGRSPVIASLEEACDPAAIDLCIAASLFTHLDTEMARTTLRGIRRALAPAGRALLTLFLIDAGVRALIGQGRAVFQFAHPHGEGAYVQDVSAPLHALAFTFDHFVGLLTEQDLYVERVLYGRWAGRPHHVSGQDILIVRRMPEN